MTLAIFMSFALGAFLVALIVMFCLLKSEPMWCGECARVTWQTRWRWQKTWKCHRCDEFKRGGQ